VKTHPRIARAVVLLSALGAVWASAGGWEQPWRTAVVFWFVAVVPGLAMLPWLGVSERLARATLAVAVSVALAAIASEGLAIAGVWSPTALIITLAAVSVAASARHEDLR
jgi:hypothetical protein